MRLFNYDQFANRLILKAILEAAEPEKPVQLMAHLLASQQTWLNRCKGLPAIGGALWPNWQAAAFQKIIDDNHTAWINFLEGLQPADFERGLTYKNSKGDSYENKLVDVLGHLINHGTHHRAQVGQHLKLAGLEKLPPTDYIFYLRN